jgi:hypothetical protein
LDDNHPLAWDFVIYVVRNLLVSWEEVTILSTNNIDREIYPETIEGMSRFIWDFKMESLEDYISILNNSNKFHDPLTLENINYYDLVDCNI